ncbi:sulfatase-like hydrolase/transferase [Haloferula sp.]|uniref:sulfatase-like hydrolase/transferase n=1 Tax=Haloferula sp. TaxID=2497595 RepID=UPI003C74000A
MNVFQTCLFVACMIPFLAAADDLSQKPNVVLILADDLGYGDLSCYGQKEYRTPAIDRLANEGVRATDFYVPVPYCAPSRASLLTGRFPFRHGMTRNPHPGTHDDVGLSPSELTLGEVFGKAGYATACIGKWHLGHVDPFLPARQGFEDYYGILYSNDMLPVQLFDRDKVVEDPVDQSLLTEKYTARAVKFIEEHKQEPFFLYLPHAMPHKPLAASENYYTPETPEDLYADVIREMDGSVAAVRQALEQAGILDRTVFIFMSDNGPSYGGSTGGLKGRKASAWEGGVRVPFIIRYPAVFPAGKEVATPLWSLDLFPTLLELAGVPLPEDVVLDGKDIIPALKGEHFGRRPIFTAHNEKIITIRDGDWKLYLEEPRYLKKSDVESQPMLNPWPDGVTIIAPEEQPGPGQYPGIIPARFSNPLPLFNLAEDPTESLDLAAEYPEIVERLKEAHQRFLKSMLRQEPQK